MTTTIAASLGHTLWTQGGPGASGGYDAIDRRRGDTAGLQEGVYAATSGMVVQRAAGATMSVDIGINAHENGIAALVQGDAVTGQGLYVVPPHTAVINEAVAAAHASLPRIDAVVLEIQDDLHDSSGGNLARVRVITGTATSGATLDNARDGSHGGAAIPSSALHLADIGIAGGATSITNANIRDRRKWARGAGYTTTSTTFPTTSSTTLALVDATNLCPRIECSGVPLRVVFRFEKSGNTNQAEFDLFVDGVGQGLGYRATGQIEGHTIEWVLTPAAGSHKIGPAVKSTSGSSITVGIGTSFPMALTVEEIVRQNAANNATTTG